MGRVVSMDTWPFTLISPEDFAILTEREKALLQCMTAAFLAFVHAQPAADVEQTATAE